MLIFQICTFQWLKCTNMKDELNCSYNGGGVVYLLQSELSRSSLQYIESLKLCVTWRFYTQKARHLKKSKTICVTFLKYTKRLTLCVTQIFMEFLKLAEVGGIFIQKKNALCFTFIYIKNNALWFTFLYINSHTLCVTFLCKKQCTLRYVFISKMYPILYTDT